MFKPKNILQWNLNLYKPRFQDLNILLQQNTPACDVCKKLISYDANPPSNYSIVKPAPARQDRQERVVAVHVHKRIAYDEAYL